MYALAANTQGLATLQMLNILENFDLRGMGFQSPAAIHLQTEAKRLAYEDRARYYADPHFAEIPVEWLNSKAYAAERAQLIRPDRMLAPVHPGRGAEPRRHHLFTVADADGMMVSMIQSNFRGMGSGLVADGLGFMFQDRGELFSLVDGHPNIYQPGKRPFHTIIPGVRRQGRPAVDLVRRDGRRHAAAGPNADHRQPRRLWARRAGRGRQSALAPRGLVSEHGRGPARDSALGVLRLETGVPAARATRARRNRLDHGAIPTAGFGRYQCIEQRTGGA